MQEPPARRSFAGAEHFGQFLADAARLFRQLTQTCPDLLLIVKMFHAEMYGDPTNDGPVLLPPWEEQASCQQMESRYSSVPRRMIVATLK
jgi:hypothetical protein